MKCSLTLAALAVLTAPISTHAAEPFQPSAQDRLRIDAGHTVAHVMNSETVKGGIDIAGATRLDADVQTVWRALVRCEAQLRFVPGLRECTVLRAGREAVPGAQDMSTRIWDERQQTLKYAFPFPTVRTQLRSTYTPLKQIDFSASGGDVKTLDGVWTVAGRPDGRTDVTYKASFKAGLPVPRSLVRKSTAKDLPLLFERLKAEVERPDA